MEEMSDLKENEKVLNRLHTVKQLHTDKQI